MLYLHLVQLTFSFFWECLFGCGFWSYLVWRVPCLQSHFRLCPLWVHCGFNNVRAIYKTSHVLMFPLCLYKGIIIISFPLCGVDFVCSVTGWEFGFKNSKLLVLWHASMMSKWQMNDKQVSANKDETFCANTFYIYYSSKLVWIILNLVVVRFWSDDKTRLQSRSSSSDVSKYFRH